MSNKKPIGLAVIGCGTMGIIRSRLARNYPGVEWLGVCDIKEELASSLAKDVNADFYTSDYKTLINRPEVNAVIVATDENSHVWPTMLAAENGHRLFIEKPLATDANDSLMVLNAIKENSVDAVVGYTNRFRRRFLAIRERLMTGQIGDVTSVITRAFMNQMVPIATTRRTQERHNLTPMVVSGTHSLDMSLWLMTGKEPVSVYAQSIDKALGQYGTKDSTFGVFTMDDGTIFSMNISWALPTVWPGAVYGIEIGIVGTKGVIDVDDTHRDLVLASEIAQGAGYKPQGYVPEMERHVDFLTSYPPGDTHGGEMWGPIREETNAWFGRIHMEMQTPHALADEGHKNLILSMAMDLSAKTGERVDLPIKIEDLY